MKSLTEKRGQRNEKKMEIWKKTKRGKNGRNGKAYPGKHIKKKNREEERRVRDDELLEENGGSRAVGKRVRRGKTVWLRKSRCEGELKRKADQRRKGRDVPGKIKRE